MRGGGTPEALLTLVGLFHLHIIIINTIIFVVVTNACLIIFIIDTSPV